MQETAYPVSVADIEAFIDTLEDDDLLGKYLDVQGCLLYQTLAWKYGEGEVLSVGGTDYDVDGERDIPIPDDVDQFLRDYRKCCGKTKAYYTTFRANTEETTDADNG